MVNLMVNLMVKQVLQPHRFNDAHAGLVQPLYALVDGPLHSMRIPPKMRKGM